MSKSNDSHKRQAEALAGTTVGTAAGQCQIGERTISRRLKDSGRRKASATTHDTHCEKSNEPVAI